MNALRLLRSLSTLLAIVLALGWASYVGAQGNCQFVLGFAALHSLIPSVVGQCLNNEYHDGVGNGYQNTTNGLMQWRKADNWTAFTNGARTWINGPYGVENRPNTQRFPWEANLEGLPVLNDGHGSPGNLYYDNRSTPESLMLSFVNSINQRQYLRTYSYWEPNAPQLPPFDQFQQGYANTNTVQITMGEIYGDAGAGNFYYTVPVTLSSQQKSGAIQTFVGCYTLHLANPGIQAPPFQSLSIKSATVQQVSPGVDPGPLMASACNQSGGRTGSPVPPTQAYPPTDISAQRYLDNRSDGVEVVRSLFNAVNRREYARAYGYWQPNAPQLQPFDQFQQGYANTQSVQLTTGTPTQDVGAGQTYFRVPVTLVSQLTNGTTQTFVGCYQLHLGSPSAQAVPPFQPIAIQKATIHQVANGTNTTGMMAQACQTP
ncbi:MAG: hypothetical protein U0822_12975 [Anaerolineae bacterium]